jgi:hypothetical protein
MNATERYRVLQNIIAQKGIDSDLIAELAKAESMINAMDQGKMIPPPLPPELSEPQSPTPLPPEEPSLEEGKYDNI